MEQSITQRILDYYDTFSVSEKQVADFFISNRTKMDFSASAIAKVNFVSEATLSRFSQRLGYQGYREFIYIYERYLEQEEFKFDSLTQNVLFTYKDLLNQTYGLIDEAQVQRIVQILNKCKYVYVYGQGNSSLCAREIKIRFMRLGLHVESVIDTHIMKMNSVLMDAQSVMIAISMSGKNLVNFLESAKANGAKTILITANDDPSLVKCCDEVLHCASIKNLDVGNVISPQFPILVLIDIIYTQFLRSGNARKRKLLEDTLAYVEKD